MKLNFIFNEYVLIWNVLFQASITEKVHRLKQKLWINYQKNYNEAFKDIGPLLKDPKNFIPDDDTIYNIMMENDTYEVLKKESEKLRVELMKLWDSYKKEVQKEFKNITRLNIDDYTILVVTPKLDMIDKSAIKTNNIVYGKKIDKEDKTRTISLIMYEILKRELTSFNDDYKDIVDAIVELATLNELPTRIGTRSHYLTGNPALNFLKRQIYPYFLMYLGYSKEELSKCMTRDKIAFDISNYTYEEKLKTIDLKKFIKFCIDNQKYIIKINNLEII